jgi:hypothetical protein
MATTTPARRKPRRPGRPSALTPEVEARILASIQCGTPRKTACVAAGVAVSTFHGWLQRAKERPSSEYARFAEKLDQAREEGITARMAMINRAARDGDWRAAAWLLERDLPETFSLKCRVEHSASAPLKWTDVLAKVRENQAHLKKVEP